MKQETVQPERAASREEDNRDHNICGNSYRTKHPTAREGPRRGEGMIYWIGNSENWDKPPQILQAQTAPEHESYVFPLVEETVLEVALSPLYLRYKHLSPMGAINCTSRFALRSALPQKLNPDWMAFHFGDGIVVKAPASCQNQGIGFAFPNEYSRRLSEYTPQMDTKAGTGVVEQYIPGPQYEADGIVIDGKVHLLAWTRQEGENGKIVRYNPMIDKYGPMLPEAPVQVIETVVKALGLDNCPFCFEMKNEIPTTYPAETNTPSQWKIIDAHARLGEDRRLWTDQTALFDRIEKIISG